MLCLIRLPNPSSEEFREGFSNRYFGNKRETQITKKSLIQITAKCGYPEEQRPKQTPIHSCQSLILRMLCFNLGHSRPLGHGAEVCARNLGLAGICCASAPAVRK